jgi:DNA-directed RNA polymerase
LNFTKWFISSTKYIGIKKTKIKPHNNSKHLLNLNKPMQKQINENKQIRSLMPNLIHSLDAASLALLIDLFFKENKNNKKNFYSVHDCFAVTCNNVNSIYKHIKAVYATIYSN